MNRRKFLSMTVHGATGAALSAVVIPAGMDALTPVFNANSDQQEWRPIGPIENFLLDKVEQSLVRYSDNPDLENIAVRSVYVWRRKETVDDDSFIVYSRSCTDLGCPVKWDPGSEWFYCPCHGGIFDKEGQRKAGPPKKPLWRYATRVHNGVLEIDIRSVPPMV